MRVGDDAAWEAMWAPYDNETYARTLGFVPRGATVLDIGAGDLRLSRRLAEQARRVYAIERRPELLPATPLPPNLIVICADARTLPFPARIDTAVLLMRHCRHFALYRTKLEAAGCTRLITNARFGMDVECIDLSARPRPYDELAMGWYACRCGATGFVAGPPERLTSSTLEHITEVENCPECKHYGRISHRIA
ncbi:MAG: rRNA adenine methyltransferase [Anaerolineae bacterium]|uniref:class I SAM-dependent methyltransferase n=1 Tax=Promineifilum sp. TaxID=2664178 RepID=UPI001DB6683B|nr:hypothetical protein [Anaerolineales bacterium]MCB8935420.1 rRNA adenine methyltransferase [Promineifilum sp.]MCO5181570.1 hypothetical protein [Promineifilum sp.]MCW5846473.1 rRNA adenine methyltransferase [Anaerolineae bacterium]